MQSSERNSDRDGAMRPDPTDHAAWDKRHPFSLGAPRRRKPAECIKEGVYKAVDPDHPELVLDSVCRAQSLGNVASLSIILKDGVYDRCAKREDPLARLRDHSIWERADVRP